MKLNLTLTGNIEVRTYAHNPPGSMYPTRDVGAIELPGKLTLAAQWFPEIARDGSKSLLDEWLRFNFSDYPSVHDSTSNVVAMALKESRKGKFGLDTSFGSIEAYTRTDASNEVWHSFRAKGGLRWVYEIQEYIEFAMSVPIKSNSLFIWAKWPQRPYPREPLEMRSQSATLDLDEKSLAKFKKFWEKIDGIPR